MEDKKEVHIELRSEKVRNIVGKVPPATERYGISVIFIVLLVLVGVSMLIPYKETINLQIRFQPETSKTVGVADVETWRAASLQKGQSVKITIEGETVEGTITELSANRINGKHRISVKLSDRDEIDLPLVLEGTVSISDKSWFEKIVSYR